jgi:adenine-specific DNA methylase
MNPTLLSKAFRDAKSIIQGMRDLFHYVRSVDENTIDVSISVFFTSDYRVQSGEKADYQLSIANAANDNLTRRFLFEIQRIGDAGQSKEHFASFEKTIFVPAKSIRTVCVTYDWKDHASFNVEGTILPPDKTMRGRPFMNGRYEVHAILFDAGNCPVENLFLIQELPG